MLWTRNNYLIFEYMKKQFLVILVCLSVVFGIISQAYWAGPKTETSAPTVNCVGLPGCADTDKSKPKDYTPKELSQSVSMKWVSRLISQMIQYVAVIAVISLMGSGLLYILSWWEEEKIKKAKTWITWSLVGVFLSLMAWWIINILNTLSIS